MADDRKADGAKSVRMSVWELNDMYIQIAMNRNGIALPNVYFCDMDQNVEITGIYCGDWFDDPVMLDPGAGDSIALTADMEWPDAKGEIPLHNLSFVGDVTIHNVRY